MDEADQIAPGKAVLHGGNGPLPDGRPHAAQQRFEAGAMFVGRPQLYLCLRKGRRHRLEQRLYLFFAGLLLFGIGQGMPRPRRLLTVLEALQIIPAPLRGHRPTERGGHPVGDVACSPAFRPVGRRAGQRLTQLLLLLGPTASAAPATTLCAAD